jgi:hypothetical protein
MATKNTDAHNEAVGANDTLGNMAIEDSLIELAKRHNGWFNGEHKTSQRKLYEVLADCMLVYERVKAQRKYADTLNEYLEAYNVRVGANSSLLGKVVKAMCGDNSSAVNAYIGVLKVAVKQGQTHKTLKDWLIECGGISKARAAYSTKQTAEQRAANVNKGIAQLQKQTVLSAHKLAEDIEWDDTNCTDYAVCLARKEGNELKLVRIFTRRGLVEELLRSVGKQANTDTQQHEAAADETEKRSTADKQALADEMNALRNAA